MKRVNQISVDKTGQALALADTAQGVNNPQADLPRLNDKTYMLCSEAAAALLERTCESLPIVEIIAHILLQHNLERILILRLVSKGCYALTSTINQYFLWSSLLANKAFVSFKYDEINPKIEGVILDQYNFADISARIHIAFSSLEKYNFAAISAGIHISISLNDFRNQSLNLAEKLRLVSKNGPLITLAIESSDELDNLHKMLENKELSEDQQLILSYSGIDLCLEFDDFMERATNLKNQLNICSKKPFAITLVFENGDAFNQADVRFLDAPLSPDEELILSKTKEIRLSDEVQIDEDNIDKLKKLLAITFSGLRKFECYGSIAAAFELSNCAVLQEVKFGYINDDLTLKNLSKVTHLEFDHISYFDAAVTLEDLPELEELSFQNIGTNIRLPICPKLKKLSFLEITNDATLTLPSSEYLDCIECRDEVLEAHEVDTNEDGSVSLRSRI